jgi:hypothetical protein
MSAGGQGLGGSVAIDPKRTCLPSSFLRTTIRLGTKFVPDGRYGLLQTIDLGQMRRSVGTQACPLKSAELFSRCHGALMFGYFFRVALIGTLALLLVAAPAQAATGTLRVVFTKAGLIGGAGVGWGILTYRGRDYHLRVVGLSLGLTAGASITKFVGEVSYMEDILDFPGTYSAIGTGGALIGGAGGVQLKNDKGVIITLRSVRAGLEIAANVSRVTLAFR